MKQYKKMYPQLVEVVNNSENPTQAVITNLPVNLSGSSVIVQVSGLSGTSTVNVRPSGSGYIVNLDNILLLQGDGTFVPIPLNTSIIGINQTQINSMLQSYKTAYATLISGVTAATLHYSKLNNSGVVTSEVYDLKSND